MNNLVLDVHRVVPTSATFKQEAEKLLPLIRQARRILISSTLTSDGDSIGGQLGLLALVRALRPDNPPQISIVDETEVPARYRFLKGSEEILDIASFNRRVAAKELSADFDLGLVCDGGVERAGLVAPLFDMIPAIALVDHHAFGSELPYAAKLLDLESSSTCELVYHLFEHYGLTVSHDIAEALFVGIIFDTGFFKHSLTRPRTHLVAAKLIATGIDFSKIADVAILERSWSAQLLLKVLMAHMKLSPDGKVVSSYWTLKDLEDVGFKDGDQEGMINQLYYTEGAHVVALFTEKSADEVKISFRSKGKFNVAEFARSIDPNGGGHVRAAGCGLKGTLAEVEALVLKKLAAAV